MSPSFKSSRSLRRTLLGAGLLLSGSAVAACAAGTGGEQIEVELAFEWVTSTELPLNQLETFSGWKTGLMIGSQPRFQIAAQAITRLRLGRIDEASYTSRSSNLTKSVGL